jgi:hypothetical protein
MSRWEDEAEELWPLSEVSRSVRSTISWDFALRLFDLVSGGRHCIKMSSTFFLPPSSPEPSSLPRSGTSDPSSSSSSHSDPEADSELPSDSSSLAISTSRLLTSGATIFVFFLEPGRE